MGEAGQMKSASFPIVNMHSKCDRIGFSSSDAMHEPLFIHSLSV